MNKKPNDFDKTNPFHIPDDGSSSQNFEHPDSTGLSSGIRADMLPGSQALPARVDFLHRINFKMLLGFLIGLAIVSLVIYYMAGYGRPKLEESIIGLIGSVDITTETAVSTHLTILVNTPVPSSNPKSTSTTKPKATKVANLVVLPSSTPTVKPTKNLEPTPTASLTSTPDCWEVSSISLADVGQTRCVRGIVLKTITKGTNFLVIFSNKSGAFYWISYDMVWSSGEAGTCYQTTGRIDRLADNPVLIFDYSNTPIECP